MVQQDPDDAVVDQVGQCREHRDQASMTIRKTIAPRVSASASARFLMNDRFSSSSYAVLIAVIRLLIPPDAAHRANGDRHHGADARLRLLAGHQLQLVGDDLAGFLRQRRGQLADLAGDLGRVGDQPVDQHQRDQRREQGQEAVEGHPGGQQRNLVGLGLGPARLTTCSQPRLGISVGLSAAPPGTSSLTRSADICSVWLTVTPDTVCCVEEDWGVLDHQDRSADR